MGVTGRERGVAAEQRPDGPRIPEGPPRQGEAAGGEGALAERELVLRPRSGWAAVDWREIWEYRELLYFLVWRDVKVRYKQTVLGVAWAVLQPVLAMTIYSVIFGRFAGLPSDGFPYPVYVYAGLLPWTFFANGVQQGGLSLVNQQHLMKKVYFPRLFVPSASVCGGLVDLAIAMGVYGVILAIYGVVPSGGVILLPLLVLLTLVSSLGFAYLLAALTVSYRDFRYVVPFMIQLLMFMSPVIYPVSIVPESYQWILALNPMAGLIDGYRSAILGQAWNPVVLLVSAGSGLLLFVVGVFYFKRTERSFADVI